MTTRTKALIASHLAVFVAGVIAGKQIDAEELASYRSAHSSASTSKWRKRFYMAAGVTSVTFFVILGMKSMRRS